MLLGVFHISDFNQDTAEHCSDETENWQIEPSFIDDIQKGSTLNLRLPSCDMFIHIVYE